MMVVAVLGGTSGGDFLFDIGTGGAGVETAVISNCLANVVSSASNTFMFTFPVAISAGTRVSARYQCTSTTPKVYAVAYLGSTNSIPLTGCTATTYGAATGDSGGTSIDAGGTANTKGSYTEIIASTTDDIDWLAINVQHANTSLTGFVSWFVDIATGGSGSESNVINNIFLQSSSSMSACIPNSYIVLPVTIASGTRIAARCQCIGNNATDRLLDVTLIGYNGTAAAGGGGAHFSASFGG